MKIKKGFTIAELLIVVSIIAILVAISFPIFSSLKEKTNRSIDMYNARCIQSALTNAFSNGDIQIPENNKNDSDGYGVWVLLCSDAKNQPKFYQLKGNETMFCGSNPNVIVKGVKGSSNYLSYNKQVESLLSENGLDIYSLKTRSNGKNKNNSWDWIVIQVGYVKGQFTSRIYSGFKGTDCGLGRNNNQTNIEKQMG